MSLLHVSIAATDPLHVARMLARFMGGTAMPFPPFPNSWIAFAEADDGTAIEVYPLTHRLEPGADQIECVVGDPGRGPSANHIAFASPLDRAEIIALGEAEGWISRLCNRGPFECVEVWLENRVLVEILDPPAQADYRDGMTSANWAQMFGLPDPS